MEPLSFGKAGNPVPAPIVFQRPSCDVFLNAFFSDEIVQEQFGQTG